MTHPAHNFALSMQEKLPLIGSRVKLCAYQEKDLQSLLPFFEDVSVLRYYLPTTVRPMNEPQLRNMLKDWNEGDLNYVFTLMQGDQVLGLINLDGLDPHNSHAEIGIAITDRAARGQGLAEEGLRLMLDYAFGELNLNRIWCRVISGNEPSLKLFTKVGFSHEGLLRRHVFRNGDYRDMQILGLLRSEYQTF